MSTGYNVIVKKVAGNDEHRRLIIGTLPDGQLNTSSVAIYSKTTGLDLSVYDFHPDINMVGLLLTAGTGAIPLVLKNGEMTITHTVTSATVEVFLRGVVIRQILSTGYTYSGYIFPLF
jgi:hypothetical protein